MINYLNFSSSLIASMLSMLFLFIIFLPMEISFPANPQQKIFRKGWVTDAFFFFGQYLLWGGLVTSVMIFFSDSIQSFLPDFFKEFISSQPIWLQIIEVIVLSDLLIYWAHRLQHHNSFLWRFHKIHHSAPHLDWLAAHREHPLDSIYTIGIINLPALIFNFPLKMIIGFIAFRGIWAIFIHTNVRISFGPLRTLIGAPELHHHHHDIDVRAGNYANLSPLMDILFGTYVNPPTEPKQIGIREPLPNNYFGQLLWPLLPHKIVTRLNQYFHIN